MKGYIHISSCQGDVIHLSIGAITVRLDRESFLILSEEMNKYSGKLQLDGRKNPPIRIVTGSRE